MDMRDQYGNRVGQMDEYGNPIQQTTDAYGNPLPSQGGYHGTQGTGLHGTTTGGYGTTAVGGGQPQMTHPEKEHRGGGLLHRSGSSSSSSSEEDGMGGRRKKKGLKEKVKEKLPGGHGADEHGHVQTTAGTGYGGTTTATTGTAGHHDPEKKGFMEKIKEKLPGHH